MKKIYQYTFLLVLTSLISACTADKTLSKAPEAHTQTDSISEKLSEGKELASQSCTKCHNSSVYTRADRTVKDLTALIARVQKCNTKTGAGLDAEELEALTLFLNTSYYKFK